MNAETDRYACPTIKAASSKPSNAHLARLTYFFHAMAIFLQTKKVQVISVQELSVYNQLYFLLTPREHPR